MGNKYTYIAFSITLDIFLGNLSCSNNIIYNDFLYLENT